LGAQIRKEERPRILASASGIREKKKKKTAN
jgi:hypothetical protein